jgi:hypothetical protein
MSRSGIIVKFDVILQVTAGYEDITVTVVIEVNQTVAPCDVSHGSCTGTGYHCHVFEHTIAQIPVKSGQFLGVGCLVEVEPAVIIIVSAIYAHASLIVAVQIISKAG